MDSSEASLALKKLLKVDRTEASTSFSSNASGSNGNSHLFDVPSDSMNVIGQPNVNGSGENALEDLLLRSFHQPSSVKQQVLLQGTDAKNSHAVYGQDVEIVASRASSIHQSATTSSSKVKINPVVNFDWENKCYIGNMVAVHLNRTHVAYVLRGKEGGNVRVYNRKTAERALLKGFFGRVIDISFAFTSSVVLGIVDEIGGLYIYDITESPSGSLSTSLRLQCNRPPGTPSSEYHRLIWCTYVPEDTEAVGSGEDASMMLLVTHDNIVEIWNVDEAVQSQKVLTYAPSEASVGRKVLADHTQPVVDAVFSPDGLHVATASLDGFAKFYELINEDNSQPRCEHNWQPHGGKPVTCIFFLDNLKDQNAETFWSFLITGTANNQELKVWSSQNWQCLQTISLTQAVDSSPVTTSVPAKPFIKAKVDLSASFVVLSDVSRKALYVLQLHQDFEASTAHVCSVSEFLLSHPVLSFALVDAGKRRLAKAAEYEGEHAWSCTTGEVGQDDDEVEVPADDRGPDVGVLVRLYAIHAKALQELQIRFQPESSVGQPLPSSFSSTSDTGTGLRDRLSDISFYSEFERNGSISSSLMVDSPIHRHSTSSSHRADMSYSSNHSPQQPLLLTPEAFSSTRVSEETLGDLPGSVSSSLTLVTAIDEDIDTLVDLRAPTARQELNIRNTDPKSLLPAEPLELFPAAKSGRLSREQSPLPNEKLLVDLSEGPSAGSVERTARTELSHSESSESSSGASAELTEIMESARQSDGLDVHTQSVSDGAYNDDDMASGDEEEEGDGRDDDLHGSDADGIRQFEKPDWSAVLGDADASPYSDQAGLENKSQRRTAQHESAGLVDPLVLDDMQCSLKHMMQLMQQQQQEIAQLRSCLNRQSQMSDSISHLTSQVEALESTVVARITDQLQQHSRTDSDNWRRTVSDMETRSHALHRELVTSFAQTIDEAVRVQLEKIVRTEISDVVIPRVVEVLNPIKDQLHSELAQKLTATDTVLKDSIAKLVRSKQTMETLSQAISSCMQSSMVSISRDVLLPSFDRACQNMFQQLAATFQRGSQEYMQQVESHMQQAQRRREESRDPVLNQLRAVTESLQRREQLHDPVHDRLTGAVEDLKRTNAQMAASSDELEAKLLKKINGLHETLVNQLKQIVQNEVSAAMRQNQAVLNERIEQTLRSGTATPVPTDHRPDQRVYKQQIMSLLQQGKTNEAFQLALSATDLSLVLFTCSSVDADDLFNDRCPLTQPVLLSLIQQLSVHFESDIELKHKFLQEALLKLDQSNPITREHSVAVLSKVVTRIGNYLAMALNTKDPVYSSMKRLRSMYEFAVKGFSMQ